MESNNDHPTESIPSLVSGTSVPHQLPVGSNLGTPNATIDDNSSKSWTPMKNNSSSGSTVKDKRHFKKSMIVEYEKIESQHNDDSQSSSSCASFGSPLLSKPLALAISQAQSKLAAIANISNVNVQNETASTLCEASTNLLSAPLINFNQHFNNLNSQISKLSSNSDLIATDSSPITKEDSSVQLNPKNLSVKKEKSSGEYESSSKTSISTKRKKEESQSDTKTSSKHKKAKSGESSHHHHHGKERREKSASDLKKSKSEKQSPSSKNSKKTKEEKKTAYCICREQANKRFMIACDNCDEWYHGACVGVSESLSNKIKSFYCHICRNKKPSLSIKYKSKFRPLADLIQKNEKFDEASADSSSVRFYKESKARLKREAELLKTTDSSKQQSKKSSEKTDQSSVKESSSIDSKIDSSINLDASSSSTKYYGKTNIPSEDIANFFSAITILNQNLPSQAVVTSENVPKTTSISSINQMDHDYLAPSTSQSSHNRPLQTSHGEAYPVRKQSRSSDEVHHDDESSLESFSSVSTSSTATSSGTSSSRTESPSDSDSSSESASNDDDEGTIDNRSSSDQDDDHNSTSNSSEREASKSKKSLKKSDQKGKANKNTKGQAKNKKGSVPKKTNLKGKKTKPVKRLNKQTKVKKTVTFGSSGGLKQSASAMSVNSNSNIGNQSDENSQRNEPSQCQGPGCVNESKENSKYCSEECGVKMARNRLIRFLGEGKFDFETMLSQSDADKLNLDAIEKINTQMELLRKKLIDLEQKHADLDKIIDRAKFSSINPNIEKDRAKSLDSNETEIYCATCGLLVSEKYALKHMEKCYNKMESLAFFGSFHKTHVESGKPLFCDYFNPQTKMYCKRLKTMCPEHEKEKKINENEVCGCPLPNPKNLLEDSQSDLCLAPKRSCSVHFKWEKLRRAQIDLEKLRTWLKLEELMEQKRLNEASLNQRRNLISLMLFKTNLTTVKSTS